MSSVPGKGWPCFLEEKQGVRGETHTALSGHDMQLVPKLWNQPTYLQSGGSLPRREDPARPLPSCRNKAPLTSQQHCPYGPLSSGLQEMKGR